jgi:hypothetical protein
MKRGIHSCEIYENAPSGKYVRREIPVREATPAERFEMCEITGAIYDLGGILVKYVDSDVPQPTHWSYAGELARAEKIEAYLQINQERKIHGNH